MNIIDIIPITLIVIGLVMVVYELILFITIEELAKLDKGAREWEATK